MLVKQVFGELLLLPSLEQLRLKAVLEAKGHLSEGLEGGYHVEKESVSSRVAQVNET